MQEIDQQEKIASLLGSALRRFVVGDYAAAIQELKAAEVLDRDNPEVRYNLGVNYCKIGLYQTAVEYFRTLLEPSWGFIDAADVRKLLAYSLIRLNRYAEAEAHLDRAVELDPTDSTALNMKGYCLVAIGKPTDALDVYEGVLIIDNGNSNARNAIAYINANRGKDLDRALELAHAVNEEDPGNPAYLDTLGYVHMKMGRHKEARQLFSAALEKAPLSAEIIAHMKELQSKRG